MTKMEAIKMVENAMFHTGEMSAKAEKIADHILQNAARGLEFEAFFEAGGEVR